MHACVQLSYSRTASPNRHQQQHNRSPGAAAAESRATGPCRQLLPTSPRPNSPVSRSPRWPLLTYSSNTKASQQHQQSDRASTRLLSDNRLHNQRRRGVHSYEQYPVHPHQFVKSRGPQTGAGKNVARQKSIEAVRMTPTDLGQPGVHFQLGSSQPAATVAKWEVEASR